MCHPHAELLLEIRREILKRTTRPGYTFHLGKVKVHSGVTGNKMADKAAGTASSGHSATEEKHVVLVGAKKYHKMYWPHMPYKPKLSKRKRNRPTDARIRRHEA